MISPVVVEMAPRQRAVAVTVTLSDTARAPVILQAELLRWVQDLQGKPLSEPSDDLLITPPIAELRPGAKQVFRLALRGQRPAPEELAYRLILEDVTEPTADGLGKESLGVNLRIRQDLPVLVAPVGKVVNALRWKPCPPKTAPASAASPAKQSASRDAEACVRLLNAGNRRVKVQTLTLISDGWQQVLSLKDGENVLVGTEREWRVPLENSQTGALRGVQVQTARGETLQAETGGF